MKRGSYEPRSKALSRIPTSSRQGLFMAFRAKILNSRIDFIFCVCVSVNCYESQFLRVFPLFFFISDLRRGKRVKLVDIDVDNNPMNLNFNASSMPVEVKKTTRCEFLVNLFFFK